MLRHGKRYRPRLLGSDEPKGPVGTTDIAKLYEFLTEVSYTNRDGDPALWRGSFFAADTFGAEALGRDFVVKYLRPQSISNASALPVGFKLTPAPPRSLGDIVAVEAGGDTCAIAGDVYTSGGDAIVKAELNGVGLDFTWPTETERIGVRVAGSTTAFAPDKFIFVAGTAPKLVWDSSGTLVWAPHNIFLRSEDYSVANWTKETTTATAAQDTAPDGTLSGWKLSCNTGAAGFFDMLYVTAIATLVGETYTIAADIKAAGFSWVGIEQQNLNTNFSYFNLTTGTLGTRHGTHTNHTITPLGNDYYRCTVTFVATTTGSHTCKLHLRSADAQTGAVTGIAGSGIYVWHMQFNRGATSLPYLPTTTAARYGCAQDYDPVTHEARGILNEPAATNLLTGSIDTVTGWNVGAGAARTVAQGTAPNGRNELAKYTMVAGAGEHWTFTGSATSATKANSIYAKAGTLSWLCVSNVGPGTDGVYFNLAAGVVGAKKGTSTGYMENCGNGIYRCVAVIPATTFATISFHSADDQGQTWTAVGGETIFVWGAQSETLTTVATSYVPTFATTATRAAETIYYLTSQIPWNDAASTVYVDYVTPRVTLANGYIWEIWKDASNRYQHNLANASVTLGSLVGSQDGTIALGATAVANTRIQVCAGFAASNFGATKDGGAVVSDVTMAAGTGYTRVCIGNTGGAASVVGHFWLRRMMILPRRASNAEMQAMVLPGGAAQIAGEMDGTGFDFLHPTDAERIYVKAAGVATPSAGIDTFFANAAAAKMVYNSSGVLVWSPHNMFINSAVPATQSVTTVVGQNYTVKVTGTGSLTASAGAAGSATQAAPLTFTATTTTSTFTLVGSLTVIQMNRGAVSTAYISTTGTAGGRAALALDYHPVTRQPRGLLSEYTSTNRATQSAMGKAGFLWIGNGSTITTSALADPSGGLEAAQVVVTPGTGPGSGLNIQQAQTGLSIGVQYTGSMWLLGTPGQQIYLDAGAGAVSQRLITFTGVWQREVSVMTATATSCYLNCECYNRSGGAHLPDVTFHCWGAQFEAGNGATTYIPTTTAAVTRAADTYNFTTPAIAAGTWWIDVEMLQQAAGSNRVITFQTGSSTPIYHGGATASAFNQFDSGHNISKAIGAPYTGRHKVMSTYRNGAQAITADGLVPAAGTTASLPGLLNPAIISLIGSNCYFRRAYYLPRYVVDAAMQAKTNLSIP